MAGISTWRVDCVLTYLGEVMNIFEMAQKAGWNDGGDCINIEKFANLVEAAARADERERIEKAWDKLYGWWESDDETETRKTT